MKRILLPLMAMSIALTSCSRDNDDVTNPIVNPVNTGILPTKIEGDITTNITYDGNKIVKWEDYDITYTGDLISKITRYGNNIRHFYFYNPDGTLKMTILDLGDILHHSPGYASYYTYKPNGIVEVEVHSISFERGNYDASQLEKLNKIFEGTYTMRNGNIYEARTTSYSIYGDERYTKETISYEYDNKNNPYKNIKGLSALALDNHLRAWAGTQFTDGGLKIIGLNNNIIKAHSQSIHFENNVEVNRENYTLNYEYKYNDKGYPINGKINNGQKVKYTYK